jgi:hypothetical protein
MANWKVSPYYKKSCEEHEYYVKDGDTIVRKTGFRGATFMVETSDARPPEFEFTFVPGGDGAQDSIDMYCCSVNNIVNVELDSMWDGWYEDIEFPDSMDDDERERLMELIEEHGVYDALENEEGWLQSETEAWIWGPILIEDENDVQVRIVCADGDGKMMDFENDQ